MAAHAQQTECIGFCVTRDDMAAFRTLSGDTNPLHDDEDFARQCGFAGEVVYGGLLIAQVSRLLGTRMPGYGCVWRSLSMNFRSPLYVGEPARLVGTLTYANEDLGLMNLKLRVEAGGRTVADGEAAAMQPRQRVVELREAE